MKHEISVLGCGVIYIDNERVFGSKPYGLFSTVNWSATDEDLKRIADRCLELVADRKTEPQKKEVEWVYNKRERLWYPYSNGELLFKTENSSEKPNNCEPQTEPLPKTINGVKIADAVAWADKWLEDNPVSEMWDMIRTLRDATEWQNEPQTERSE